MSKLVRVTRVVSFVEEAYMEVDDGDVVSELSATDADCACLEWRDISGGDFEADEYEFELAKEEVA